MIRECFNPSFKNGDKCDDYIEPNRGARLVDQFEPFCGITFEPCPTCGMSIEWHQKEAEMWGFEEDHKE
jgi:hypothetical protein